MPLPSVTKPLTASLSVSNYPVVLVATKCDNPEELRELDTASVAAAYPSVLANFTTSPTSPNTTRDCLQVILRAVVTGRKGAKPHPPPSFLCPDPELLLFMDLPGVQVLKDHDSCFTVPKADFPSPLS